MEILKVGHSCVVVSEGVTQIVVDPGAFTVAEGVGALENITAVVYTHKHADHLEESRLSVLKANNPDLLVFANEETGEVLNQLSVAWQPLPTNGEFEIGELTIHCYEVDHHPIYKDVPVVKNTALLFNESFLHPGDALFVPPKPVKVLGMPFGPFASIGECLEYGNEVQPEMIIPLHDGYITGPNPYTSIPATFWPESGINYHLLGNGEVLEI